MILTLIFVTLGSLLVATAMAAFAWRLAQEERRRAQARIAALTAAIHRDDWPLREASTTLFSANDSGHRSSRVTLVAALGIFLAGSLAVALVFRELPSKATAHAAPLELTALTHERDADRLTVRGVVRNPAAAAAVGPLTAVVFLCSHDGGIIATGRAPIQRTKLEPGAESPFVVTIPVATEVGSYRVSFMTGTGVVSHIDRRSRAVAQVP
jgi:hypothetical protein